MPTRLDQMISNYDKKMRRRQFADHPRVDWEFCERFLGFGGCLDEWAMIGNENKIIAVERKDEGTNRWRSVPVHAYPYDLYLWREKKKALLVEWAKPDPNEEAELAERATELATA